MHSAFPRISHVGHTKQKKLLQYWSVAFADEPRCHALYFQAGGGLGKTWLLNSYPEIVQAVAPDLRIAAIIDFYNFENRNPHVIESKLIQSLKKAPEQAQPWYCLPAQQVDIAFKAYTEFYRRYMRAREQGSREQRMYTPERVREKFIECWNGLAATSPLVMRFDTIETLYNPPAPEEALVNAAGAATGAQLVLDWMTTVLPQLQHTLVLFSGRPLRDRPDHPFVEQLESHQLLVEPLQELTPFNEVQEVQEYLQRYTGAPLPEEQIPYILAITEGHPLLLTCYAETLCSELGLPPTLPFEKVIRTRKEFENWLVTTILNPLGYADPQQTLLYSLHFLSYARRGIHRAELHRLFEHAGLEDHERQVVDTIGNVALVKVVQDREIGSFVSSEGGSQSDNDLLFLHDEIHLLVDELGLQSELGLRELTLDYLASINKKQVRQLKYYAAPITHPDSLLKAMSNQLYYELANEVAIGYRTYMVYIGWLLNERNIDDTLILSDVLWSTLEYRVQRNGQIIAPYRDALEDSSALTYDEILVDEQVNRLALLIGQGQNQESAAYAEFLYQHWSGARMFPDDDHNIRDPQSFPADHPFRLKYLYANFTIRRAHAILLAEGTAGAQRAEGLFTKVIDFLEARNLSQGDQREELLALRRDYFLGRVYTLRGYLRRQQQRFAEAQADYEHGRIAFKRYREQPVLYRGEQRFPEEVLNDYVLGDLAQVTNNLAYNLALVGNLKRALRLSNEVVQEFVPISALYLQARFYNTNALIRLLAGDYKSATGPLLRAEQVAKDSGSSRVMGLVAQARGFFERTRMNHHGEARPEIEEYYRTAAEYLDGEPAALYELYVDWAKFERDLSKLYRVAGQVHKTRQHEQRALELLESALAILPDEPSMQYIDVLENKIVLYNNMERFEEAAKLLEQAEAMMDVRMPAYGQILSGKLALQRGYLAFYRQHNAQLSLRFLAIALARVYVFARHHRDQQTFEQLIREHIERIPPRYLEAFKQQTEREDLYITSDELPYQRPNAVQWSNAWEESIAYMSDVIAQQLQESS